jgi:cellulose synthase/poly-beta-1,6-N-acetylglucosamine synthase-like glycosyltransferase
LLFYTYSGYFILLKFISFYRSNPVQRGKYLPEATLLIPVFNGEKVIRDKLENCLKLDYPRDKFRIIVVSDSSSDRTDEVAQSYLKQGVKLIRLEKRGGKTRALNSALKDIQTELVFFTDASTLLKEESLRNIARTFFDPDVGCVSGEDQSISTTSEKSEAGEVLYVGLEMKLRRLESIIGNLTGVSGCLYAIRKELVQEIPNDFIDDFYLPLEIVKKGKRVISEPEAVAYVTKVSGFKEEFRRRRRTTLGGLEVFFSEFPLLNPFKYGIFSLELLSHKLLRWLTPFLLLLLFLSSIFLLNTHFIFKLTFLFELITILIALIHWLFLKDKKLSGIFSYAESIFYFYLVNLALFLAWVKFISGKREIIWEPSKR